jgi:hypothetical protein
LLELLRFVAQTSINGGTEKKALLNSFGRPASKWLRQQI